MASRKKTQGELADAQVTGAPEPLDVEAALLEDVLAEGFGEPVRTGGDDAPAPSVADDEEELVDESQAVFDDEFIRARRAANAARGLTSLARYAEQPGDRGHARANVPDDGLSEEILGSRVAWRGNFLRVDDMSVRLPNGRLAQRDVVRHPGAVAVIALTDEGKLVLVHQYRTALEQVTLEIPAGKLTPGEDPAAAAARELEEETGYRATRMAYLGPIAVAAGYSDEIIHIYMAMGLQFVGARPDEDEFVHVDLVDLDEMVDRVLDGKVIDSKTVLGVLLCDAIARRMNPQD